MTIPDLDGAGNRVPDPERSRERKKGGRGGWCGVRDAAGGVVAGGGLGSFS
jgi:hypothetical protein